MRKLNRLPRYLSALICAAALILFLPRAWPQASKEIVIDVTGSAEGTATASETGFLNGWAESVEGQTIVYHSAVPGATNALIVRAQRIAHSITWKTDPLPNSVKGDTYRLLWLAGLDFSGWAEDKTEHS